jgi:hypothetical protein
MTSTSTSQTSNTCPGSHSISQLKEAIVTYTALCDAFDRSSSRLEFDALSTQIWGVLGYIRHLQECGFEPSDIDTMPLPEALLENLEDEALDPIIQTFANCYEARCAGTQTSLRSN